MNILESDEELKIDTNSYDYSIEIEIPKSLLRNILCSEERKTLLYRRPNETAIVFMHREDGIELWVHQDHQFSPFALIPKDQMRILAQDGRSLRPSIGFSENVKLKISRSYLPAYTG